MSDWKKEHGRIERRRLVRVDLDHDISLFPGARQFVRITREWMEGKSDELKSETRYFITSLEAGERSAARLAQAIRGHWSVENPNHWKRDTSLWKEDASRPRKKASGGQVLAQLRGAILRLHDMEAFESLNAGFHHHSAKPWAALPRSFLAAVFRRVSCLPVRCRRESECGRHRGGLPRVGGVIAHGVLLVGYFSALLASQLPGPGALARSLSVRFKSPTRPGDDVRIEVKIVDLVPRIRKAVLEGRAYIGDKVLLQITAETLSEE